MTLRVKLSMMKQRKIFNFFFNKENTMSASLLAQYDYAHATRNLAYATKRLAEFREDHQRGIVSAQLVRQYELLVSYAERDVESAYAVWMNTRG